MTCKYFLPFCRLSFHFIDEFLSVQKLLVWCSSTCLVLLLLPLLFDVISRKSSPGLMTRNLQPMFSVRSLMVSGFKPSVHFESVFCFPRCLSACVFTSLFLYLVHLWMLAVFLFSWCAQRTPSGFLSGWQTPFLLVCSCVLKDFFPSGSHFMICSYFFSAFWKYETAAFWLLLLLLRSPF